MFTGDGFKDPTGRAVITFSDEKDGVGAHKDTVYMKTTKENVAEIFKLYEEQIRTGGGFKEYICTTADNVDYMREVMEELELAARKLGKTLLGFDCHRLPLLLTVANC